MPCASESRCFCTPAELATRGGCPWGLARYSPSGANSSAAGFLGRVAIFRSVDGESLARLAATSRSCSFEVGDMLVQAGIATNDLLVIEDGRVGLMHSRGGLWDQALAVVGPGYGVNLAAAIDQGPAPFSARALTGGSALAIKGEELRALVERTPALARELLLCMAGQIRGLATLSGELSLLTLEERLVRFILRHASGDRPEPGAYSLTPWTFTHEEVAANVGGSREEVTRLLGRLRRKGLIEISRRNVVVRDRDALARHAPRV